MATWAKPVEAKDIQESELYFLGKNVTAHSPEMAASWLFYSKDIKGKLKWASKPGIALRIRGDQKLREILAENPHLQAIPVPKDADQRWKRRQRRLW